MPKYPDVKEEELEGILQKEIGAVFCEVLKDAGVFKTDEAGRKAFERFINSL